MSSSLENFRICFAANAVSSRGGQGEFLRQMVYALDPLPLSEIISRGATAQRAKCIDVPFSGWRARCFQALRKIPRLRGRVDWLTLLNDVQFDSQVKNYVSDANLFHGVMAQCADTFQQLAGGRVPLVLTALNSHIENVAHVLEQERRLMGSSAPSFIHPGMRKRVKREIERATAIHAVSRFTKDSFIEYGAEPSRIHVVNPAVDFDHFHPVAKPDDVFRVLAVMTIDLRKGAYYLLKAFERAAIPHSELVIIGSTGDPWSRKMLAQLTSRFSNVRIQRADVVTDPIEKTYGSASVLVHPALEDGFALVVPQALACGVPVIATRQTGASQLIDDGANGFVVESRDIDGLVDRLRLLSSDESLRMRLQQAAAPSVAHLTYANFARQMSEIYSSVLA